MFPLKNQLVIFMCASIMTSPVFAEDDDDNDDRIRTKPKLVRVMKFEVPIEQSKSIFDGAKATERLIPGEKGRIEMVGPTGKGVEGDITDFKLIIACEKPFFETTNIALCAADITGTVESDDEALIDMRMRGRFNITAEQFAALGANLASGQPADMRSFYSSYYLEFHSADPRYQDLESVTFLTREVELEPMGDPGPSGLPNSVWKHVVYEIEEEIASEP